MTPTQAASRVETHVHALVGALQDWVDAERAEAEKRVGSAATEAVLADARYDGALQVWGELGKAMVAWREFAGVGS
jgi:hypothetical protein